MTKKTKLTKTLVAGLKPPDAGTADHRRGYMLVWDADLPGFGVYVTNNGAKSYIVRSRIRGKERRKKVGSAQVLAADRARDLARAWLGKICEGRDPVAEARQAAISAVTLRDAIDEYCGSGRLRASTQALVRSRLGRAFEDWLQRPLLSITEDAVERRWKDIAPTRPGDALICFRYLRSAWNHARERATDDAGNPLLPECPTRRLKALWKGKDTRRQRIIPVHRLPAWIAVVDSLEDPVARAFFRFLLFTGCRRSEAAALRWDDVDLIGRAVTFRTTKTESYAVPICTQLAVVLAALPRMGFEVFADARGQARLPRTAFHAEIRQIVRIYGDFGPHDLRRGFVTMAEHVGIPSMSVKRLVGHSTRQDVTGGYFASTVEALRPHAQRIGDTFQAALLATGNVIPIRPIEARA